MAESISSFDKNDLDEDFISEICNQLDPLEKDKIEFLYKYYLKSEYLKRFATDLVLMLFLKIKKVFSSSS